MKSAVTTAIRPILLGSILALAQPVFAVGEPVFEARPVVSSVPADNPDVPATVACGKTLVIPIVVSDPDGDAVSYTVTTSQPWLVARARTGHPVLKMRVTSTNDGSGAPIDGTMEFALFRAETPDTAGFIAGFAQAPYYENVLFHRVIKDFVLQGGDPAGTGSGASPYTLPHEFQSHLIYSGRGQLAMANSSGGYSQTFSSYGRTFASTNQFGIQDGTTEYITATTTPTNGSQFFITLGQPRHLDFKHTLFGQLLRGFDVMNKIANVPVNSSDKPTANVTMSELTVKPSSTDAILYVSATNVGTGAVTVTAKDSTGKTSQKVYTITSVKDTVNDPPIIAPFEPQVIPVGDIPTVRAVTEDLEHDAMSVRMPLSIKRTFFNGTPTSSQTIYAGVNSGNLEAVARPTAGAWDITVGVSGFNDPLLSSSPFDASRFQMLEVGVGDKAIEGTPRTIEAKAGIATGDSILATFRFGGTAPKASDFVASVIWGDGSVKQTSSGASPAISIVPSVEMPGAWEVHGNHTYARHGVYPVHVTLDGPLGGTATAKGTAVVAADGALFSAIGQSHDVKGALFSIKPIAVISDSTIGVKPGDFSAVIDWGDGKRTTDGVTVRQIGVGRFGVYAQHRYADAETYSVMVTLTRAGFSDTAWSTLKVSGFTSPRYLPPFSKAHLYAQWAPSVQISATEQVSGLPEKTIVGRQTTLSGYFFILSSGNKPVLSPKLRFYLSNDSTLQKTGNGADRLLTVGPVGGTVTQIPLRSLSPGQSGNVPIQNRNGLNLALQLPLDETAAGKYLITELGYSDPITDNMLVPKTVVYGPFSGINVKLPGNQTSLSVTEVLAPTTTFTVALDTLPTGDVTIPLQVLNLNSTLDESQITVSPSQLVFTPQNGKIPQTVTVTAKDDTIKESTVQNVVRLAPATSTDTRFNNMDATDVGVTISDNDTSGTKGILVSKASLSLTEGGSTTFTVRPSASPTQTATMALDIVDENGAVIAGQANLSPGTVTFTTANGTNEITVTVTAVNDAIAESTRNLTIRLKAITSTDTTFSGIDPVDIPLTILDND